MKQVKKLEWSVLLFFFIIQLFIIFLARNGPFFDEGIYISAGLRTIDGYGYSDGYLVWFAGHLIWPLLAGIGMKVGGLIGVRLIALFLAEIAIMSITFGAKNIFGKKTGIWTVLLLAVSGPVFSLSHLGVYDLPAFAGLSVSFWAVTKLHKTDNRIFLVLSAITFTFGILSKYPAVAMILPLMGMLYILREEKSKLDIGIFMFFILALIQPLVLPYREQVGAWLEWTLANKPSFGSTKEMIVHAQLFFTGLPIAIGFFAFLFKRDKLSVLLFGSALIWPTYHILTGNPVSDWKHLTFGYIFLYPLIGSLFSAFTGKKVAFPILMFLGLASLGINQIIILESAWPDVRPGAQFLMKHVDPGEKLLINNSWSYNMYLLDNGNIETPWDVFDTYRVTHDQHILEELDICDFDWFVNEQGSYSWSQEIIEEVTQRCGFSLVFTFESKMVGLASDLQYHEALVKTEIWSRH